MRRVRDGLRRLKMIGQKGKSMYKIEVLVKEGRKRDGGTFPIFQAVTGNKITDLRFRKTCEVPKEHCFIYVEDDKINRDDRGRYPVYWVKEIFKVEKFEKKPTDFSDVFEKVD